MKRNKFNKVRIIETRRIFLKAKKLYTVNNKTDKVVIITNFNGLILFFIFIYGLDFFL